MRWIGILLMWLGFFAGAYFSVAYTEAAENKWTTIPWPFYAISMTVCLAGIILIRGAKKAEAGHSDKVENQIEVLSDRLRKLVAKVGKLKKLAKTIPPNEVANSIDNDCSPLYSDFADQRNGLSQRFGLDAFAEIMTAFASAERYTNRAWSASADGYRDEAVDSLETAHIYLQTADEKLNQYMSAEAS